MDQTANKSHTNVESDNVSKTGKGRETGKAGGQADQQGSWEFLDLDSSDPSGAAREASCCSPPATVQQRPKDYSALHAPLWLSVP